MTIRTDIDRRISQIGLIRATVYLALHFVMLVVVLKAWPIFNERLPQAGPYVAFGLWISAIVVIMYTIDRIVFSSRVRCPCCDGNLWSYLTKGIKRRKFRLPREFTHCPLCGADSSRTIPRTPIAQQADVET